MRELLIIVVLVAAGLAGCIGTDDAAVDPANATDTTRDGAFEPTREDAQWANPQHFPHPAFGWPTLTHVPEDAPGFWQPIDGQPLPSEPGGLEHVAGTDEGTTGDGMAVFGSLAVIPGWIPTNSRDVGEIPPVRVVDISDPENPEELATFDPGMSTRQAELLPFPDGRLFVALATNSGLIPVWNLTDPTDPTEATIIQVPNNGHTIWNVPGTPILYNANTAGSLPAFPLAPEPSESRGGVTEIYDLSDPYEPELVDEWENGYGCHMISFHITQERSRGYCTAVDATQIWDVSEPTDPEVVSTTPFPHGEDSAPGGPPYVSNSHWAVVNENATVMAVADETTGSLGPTCDAHAQAGDQSVSGPLGNVWFYDITDEENPEMVGWISPGAHLDPDEPPSACTAHMGRLVPHDSQDLLVMAYEQAGVVLIDFTNPSTPTIEAQWTGEDPMDAWYYNGYVFAGDRYDGLDVLTFTEGEN